MIQAVLLALVAGYADTVGFLRYEAFAGLMTGNTILLGIEVAGGKWREAGFHLAIFGLVWIAYAVGAGLGALANAAMTHPLLLPALLLPVVMLPITPRASR